MTPSSLVELVGRILPQAPTANVRVASEMESAPDAFTYMAERTLHPTPESAAIRQIFEEQEAYRPRISAMERAAAGRPAAFTDEQLAARFFGDDMRLSPSLSLIHI